VPGERRGPRATLSLLVGALGSLLLVALAATTTAPVREAVTSQAPVREAVATVARVIVPDGPERAHGRPSAEAPSAAASAAEGSSLGQRDGDGGGQPAGVAEVLVVSPTAPMATVGALTLHVPGEDAVVVGFHEASTRVPLDLVPLGPMLANENTTRFAPTRAVAGAQPYHVLSSRGRAAGPTSAVDIVLRDDQSVLAPISGVVSDVREYWLYGRYLDTRLEIRPHDARDLRVVMVHVSDPQVAAGDHVVVGETVVAAGPTRFPFSSQIDRETEPERWPHVHLEVQPWGLPRPGDEAPAAEDAAGDRGDAPQDADDA
jgi:hypothetical protein